MRGAIGTALASVAAEPKLLLLDVAERPSASARIEWHQRRGSGRHVSGECAQASALLDSRIGHETVDVRGCASLGSEIDTMPILGTIVKMIVPILGISMANNLRALREGRSWSQEQAAIALGTTRNQYVKLEGGSRRLSDVWIARAASAYGVDAGDIVTDRRGTVAVVGYVGAGSEAHFYGESQGMLGEARAPDGAKPETVAVEVRGDSLGPIFDGWLVTYDDVRSPFTDDLLGRLCVVGLDDGRVLVKMVSRAKTAPDRFDLHGQFGEPIRNVALDWAAPVKSFQPR